MILAFVVVVINEDARWPTITKYEVDSVNETKIGGGWGRRGVRMFFWGSKQAKFIDRERKQTFLWKEIEIERDRERIML